MKYLMCMLLLFALWTSPVRANGEGAQPPEKAAVEEPVHARQLGYEVAGIATHPYCGLTLNRVDDRWSTGFLVGMEADLGAQTFAEIAVEWHDILTEYETYPFNETVQVGLGWYWVGEHGAELMGVTTFPSCAITLGRVDERWSTGFRFRCDAELGTSTAAMVGLQVHDILSTGGNDASSGDVYAWDQTFSLGFVYYW